VSIIYVDSIIAPIASARGVRPPNLRFIIEQFVKLGLLGWYARNQEVVLKLRDFQKKAFPAIMSSVLWKSFAS